MAAVDHFEVWCVFPDGRDSIHVLSFAPGESHSWTVQVKHVGGYFETRPVDADGNLATYPNAISEPSDEVNLHGSLAGVALPTELHGPGRVVPGPGPISDRAVGGPDNLEGLPRATTADLDQADRHRP